jgi:hypothetical protein
MSEQSEFKRRKKLVIPKPTKKGLPCPACKGHTVQRDVSPEDKWYVEVCINGQVTVSTRVDGREIFEKVDCEYWGAGFEQRR